MAATGTVRVVFIDADSGQVFTRSELPSTRLPDSFAVDTMMHLGDAPWRVEHAEPMTAAEAIGAGQVTLTVRRLQRVPPQEILYSLPTICDTLPTLGAVPASADSLQLHEDSWRQVELASRSHTAAISAELDAIRQVYTDHGRRDAEGRWFAFERIHLRSITSITEPLSWPHLRGLLPTADRTYRGVQFPGAPTLVAGSFALGSGSVSCYGVLDQDQVPVIGIATTPGQGAVPMAALEAVLVAFDLLLVDWCRAAMVEPDRLGDYLDSIRAA
jgi:hypothetical protein